MTMTLAVRPRTGSIKAATQQGDIPAVVYGPKQESTPLAVDKQAFEKLFADAGESTIITLTGLTEPIEVLVHDVQFDPVRGGAIHVDFYAIERGKELTTEVPLEFIGEAPAEKFGSIVKALHEVEVTCRPSALPNHIEVDLSVLTDEDSHILVRDLTVPEGVIIENDPEAVVATVAITKEENDEALQTPDMDAIQEVATKTADSSAD